MTAQEIFTKVVLHLRKQGVRASDDEGNCKYLTDDGLKCAVGCLIPNGHPGERHIGDVGSLLRRFPDLALIFGGHYALLQDLQGAHDRYFHTLDQLEPRLAAIAAKHKLTVPANG